jgi:hypothetical protein
MTVFIPLIAIFLVISEAKIPIFKIYKFKVEIIRFWKEGFPLLQQMNRSEVVFSLEINRDHTVV